MRYIFSPAYQAVESSMVPALAAILRSTLKPSIEYSCDFQEVADICPNDRIAALVLTECSFAPMLNPRMWTQKLPGRPELGDVDTQDYIENDPTTLAVRFRTMAATLDPAGLVHR